MWASFNLGNGLPKLNEAHMNDVVWKWIPGYEKLYEVSSHGEVRRVTSSHAHGYCKVRVWQGRTLKQKNVNGRRYVTLCKYGQSKEYLVHRLVLFAFIGPCPPGMEACHFPDTNPSNNNLDNLRWDTPKNNHADKIKSGTTAKGESNPRARLSDNAIRVILASRSHVKASYLAQLFNTDDAMIYRIWSRKAWRHVTLEDPQPHLA